jgi:HCOMODA/2-hydroxy-3-carboxy-muconic semialdehyde decarboxylase
MSVLDQASSAARRVILDIVIANRILANEGVLDAYGHVSARNPDDPARFYLSRSLAPELVTVDDIVEYHLDGRAVSDERAPYLERFIHGSLYASRPDFQSVVHGHAESVLPFTISGVPLYAVVHDAGGIGPRVPVWDIRDRFGDATNLLVVSEAMGDDLARRLGEDRVVLMRGHGFAAGAGAVSTVVRNSVFLARNAHVLAVAMGLGGSIVPLSEGEVAAREALDPESSAMRRSWNYWANRAGCADLLDDDGSRSAALASSRYEA